MVEVELNGSTGHFLCRISYGKVFKSNFNGLGVLSVYRTMAPIAQKYHSGARRYKHLIMDQIEALMLSWSGDGEIAVGRLLLSSYHDQDPALRRARH